MDTTTRQENTMNVTAHLRTAEQQRRIDCHGNTSPCLPDVHRVYMMIRDRAAGVTR